MMLPTISRSRWQADAHRRRTVRSSTPNSPAIRGCGQPWSGISQMSVDLAVRDPARAS